MRAERDTGQREMVGGMYSDRWQQRDTEMDRQGETQRHGDRREKEVETSHSYTEAHNRVSYRHRGQTGQRET